MASIAGRFKLPVCAHSGGRTSAADHAYADLFHKPPKANFCDRTATPNLIFSPTIACLKNRLWAVHAPQPVWGLARGSEDELEGRKVSSSGNVR
jgi:hypothetical protein